jgi:calcium-binding protein CML
MATKTKSQQKNSQLIISSRYEKEKELQELKTPKEERDAEIKSVFKLFDKNGDGRLEKSEIKSFMIALGRETSDEEVQKLMEKVDLDKNGFITIDEFIEYMDETYVISKDQVNELIDAFRIFDVDNSGNISKNEFKNILTKYGKNEFTDEDIEDIFNLIDIDKDGSINYAEFIEMWKYQ